MECWRNRDDVRFLALYSSGWSDNELITINEWKDRQHVYKCPSCGGAIDGVFNHPLWRDFSCSEGNEVLGEWRFRLTGDTSGRVGDATILVAEDCTVVEQEFVPEPGTIILLGSGLMGLVGCGALHWRVRK
ncbi:MAG TPA: PEP-CTERM sorting domain-containing protein [Chloroflexi bacterium]|nr:PEP-CTERM sorting domain-containing protein [Chloroflexota bacterium]